MDIVYRHPNGFFVEARTWNNRPDSDPYVAPDGAILVWVEAYMDTRRVLPDQIMWTSDE